MKIVSLIAALLCISGAYAQNASLYNQLCHLNGEWVKKSPSAFLLQSDTYHECDSRLIQKHLSLVEESLRQNTPSGLSEKQLENRQKCLAILHTYHQNGIFPVNLYHEERTPYFIDHLGTACAVGHLIIETGFPEISQKIHDENNYGYVHDLVKKYPEILQWAREYGFTEDELAWIQPTYGGCSMSGQGMVMFSSCATSCDGFVVLPDPGTMPPYVINGPSCSSLCPGNYTWTITDGNSNTTGYNYTIGYNSTVDFYTAPTNCSAASSCDGTITATPISGIAPFYYSLYDQSMNLISSGTDSIFNGICAGDYYVYVIDSYGCSTPNPQQVTITEPGLGIENSNEKNSTVFPNPANGMVTIEGVSIHQVILYNIAGKELLNTSFTHQSSVTLDISAFDKGTYLIYCFDGTKTFKSILLIK